MLLYYILGHSSVKRSHDGLIKKSRGRTKNGEKLRKGDVIYYFNNDQVSIHWKHLCVLTFLSWTNEISSLIV